MKKADTPGQTLLRWQFQRPLPKPVEKTVKSDNNSSTGRHIKDTAKVSDS